MECSYCQAYQAYVNAVLAEHERYMAAITGQNQARKNEYNLVPTVLSNGGIQYTDMNGHGYLTVVPQANGEYAYYGTEAVIQRLLGRSELDRIGPKMKDKIFSND